MEIVIFDAKIRQDDESKQFLGNAIAALYFFYGTSLKVSFPPFCFCIFFFVLFIFLNNKINK